METPHYETHSHFKMYKPYGYISQFIINGKQKRSKKLLGELFDFPEGTMAIGRLDEKSEGLLLLTTNGKVSTMITSGSYEKEYYIQVDGAITEMAIEMIKKGVEIGFDGKRYCTKPCEAHLLEKIPTFPKRSKNIRDGRHGPTSWISITLTEGKFRQVRKMTSVVGFPTLRLVRVRIGDMYLGNLDSGEVEVLDTIL